MRPAVVILALAAACRTPAPARPPASPVAATAPGNPDPAAPPDPAPSAADRNPGPDADRNLGPDARTDARNPGPDADRNPGPDADRNPGPDGRDGPPPLPGQPPPAGPTSLGTVVVADSDRCGLTLDTIYFLPNSAVIRNQDSVLDGLAVMFRCFYASGEITRWGVVGSADGHEKQPVQISDERARTVARELVSRGVPADALVVQAVGATQPVDPGQTADGQAKNRQVTFSVLVRKN